ncbi:MAG TPA: BolA family protein [Pusillimonas sp.]|jgi:BolA protein|uniref:BolA family protein n=1 Tax=unclassified Pusillimonas TaxID=2640016 RepID=UPI0026299668|nr:MULTISPECIES: BolA family protein [unclassified Pusillimonas]HLU20763.1 BolA family protein [Pusillimonas sp.]
MSTTHSIATERAALLRERLQALDPTLLEIMDESHLHAGHAGARDGASHFRVIIATPQFAGLGPLARHRLVYDRVQDLIPHPIHALAIETSKT